MQIITRMKGNSLVIVLDGEEMIELEVAEIRGDKVRLAISGPLAYCVRRKEVWDILKRTGNECRGYCVEGLSAAGPVEVDHANTL